MDFLHVMTIRLNIAEQIPNTSEAKKTVFAAMLTGSVSFDDERLNMEEVTPAMKTEMVVRSRY